VLFMQGGATAQFAAIPMNLMRNKVADYIVSGSWSKKAFKEAGIYGKANLLASSEDETFSYVPDVDAIEVSDDADYVYICQNETIYGTRYSKLPDTKGKPLVADVSSMFLSEPVDVSKYGLIYGGVQKNVGPAGMAIGIVRDDLIREDVLPFTPTIMRYSTMAANDSMYNTPPCYTIYMCGLVFKWLKEQGGIEAIYERNKAKAALLYDFLDQSALFKPTARKQDRSLMNVPFITGSDELDAKFIAEAAEHGLVQVKGHRSVGGMRASIYNAMPEEGVAALVGFMAEFEKENA
jgi:phosphoserine aminotransferase